MIASIHHVGIAVKRLSDAYRLYRDLLGLPLIKEAEVADQGVRAALLAAGDSEVELLEPLGPDSGLARFVAKHGEGLHHVCFQSADVAADLGTLKEKGAELIDAVPRKGLAGMIGFLHPRACAGVLVELATPFAGEGGAPHASALRLKRLIIGAQDPRATAARFRGLFALSELPMNGGPRVMLTVGRSELLIVPDGEVGGREGMVALSMVAADFERLLAGFERAGTPVLRGTGEVTLEPATTHGVHLHIARYE
ncbi:MAG: methylmalonyl-CoA epimerase [Candidatus Rokubacteria bacterium]|nr:methylmalonyl-CoA epimerase [Candidatus Rokubacteria bacterium]